MASNFRVTDNSILASLDIQEAECVYKSLLELGTLRHVKKGDIAFSPLKYPNKICFIMHGFLIGKRYTCDGREMNVRYYKNGENDLLFFINVYADNSPIKSYYYASEDTDMIIICKDALDDLMNAHPSFAKATLRSFCSVTMERLEHLYNLEYSKVREKLCAWLLSCYDKSNLKTRSYTVELPLNQTDFASFMFTSREALNRELHSMEKEGFIKFNSKSEIYVPDIEDIINIVSN